MFKILFTSIGRRVELIQAFRKAAFDSKTNLMIYGADMSTDAPALFYCDKTFQICRISDENYIPSLLNICKDNKIDLLIPTIDTDLLKLSENKVSFSKIGTTVMVSDYNMIKICRDKRLTYNFFVECGLNSPATFDDKDKYNLSYPCFIKPKDGSSSVNAFSVKNKNELCYLSTQVKDYIIQPFIQGEEYTVDIFCDFLGQPIYIVPRKRLATRSGEVLKTKIIYDSNIINDCKKLIDKFKPCGPLTVQLIRETSTNIDYYIEINPRYGGGAPLSIKAGANSPLAILSLLEGENLYFNNNFETEVIYSRFDQSIRVTPKSNSIKAYIFDLDDTLYNEIDYVYSGFKKVSEFLLSYTGTDVFDELKNCFINKLPAIDEVLKMHNLKEISLRNKCLDIYRNHIPSITLSDDIKNHLKELREKGFKLGIITDGRPEGQRAKIEALGLRYYVDEIIITDELGGPIFRKPNDISFRIMKCLLNVEFDEMMYIGDNLKKDFIAPQSLGIKYYWYQNPNGLYNN